MQPDAGICVLTLLSLFQWTDMLLSRDLQVYPYFNEQEYEVNNSIMHCDTSPDTYRLHKRWVLGFASFNQVNWQGQRRFRRCTRQRDASLVYNVGNCYKSKENSYRHPTRGNRIWSIPTSTLTIDCSQSSSTKRCRDRDWREWLYHPWTCTTDENPTRSHQTSIFESTRLHCTIMCTCISISRWLPLTVHVRLRRKGCWKTDSAYRDNYTMKVNLRRRSYPTAKLTYDENDDIVIVYSMSIYDSGEYPLQWPCDSGRANTIHLQTKRLHPTGWLS